MGSRTKLRGVSVIVLVLTLGLGESVRAQVVSKEEAMHFELTSTAFPDGQTIPSRYTCEGEDISPELSWGLPPSGTKAFALISDDPDAPRGTWVHWVVYNIPSSVRQLSEAFPKDAELPDGTRQGMTDFGRIGYGGPCPPSGIHRYFFKLYALERTLPLPPGVTAKELEESMYGHVLAEAKLLGTYRRKDR